MAKEGLGATGAGDCGSLKRSAYEQLYLLKFGVPNVQSRSQDFVERGSRYFGGRKLCSRI